MTLCMTVHRSALIDFRSARDSAAISATRYCTGPYRTVRHYTVSNGSSGGQIMLIAIMLALWRMYR